MSAVSLPANGQPAPVGNKLAEGDEVNFVVGENALAGGVEQEGGVGGEPLPCRVTFPVDDADQEITGGIARNFLGALREKRDPAW